MGLELLDPFARPETLKLHFEAVSVAPDPLCVGVWVSVVIYFWFATPHDTSGFALPD